MWEFCIETNQTNAHFLKYISQRVAPVLRKISGVQSLIVSPSTSSLALGCPLTRKKEFQNFLRTVLCDTICEEMKFDFLKKHLALAFSGEALFDAFAKVYTYFDAEVERKIVLRTLFFDNKLVLESFFEFKLPALKRKWQEMCNLANSNTVFFKSETFLELLKFLIANLEIKMDCLVFDLKALNMFEEKQNVHQFICHFENVDDREIITKMVELSPQKIKIICGTNNEIINLLLSLFGERIEVL